MIILIDNSEKRLTAIFELFLCQQSVFKVFQLLEKHLDQSEIPLQEVKKIRYWPLWGHWSRKIKDFEANSIIRSNIMREKWMKDTIKYYTSPLTTFLDIHTLNVDCWYSKDSNITVNHVSEKLIRIIKFKISFQIFNLKVVARIVFVSLRAFKWYQNHENWPRRTISNVIQSCINH